MGQMLVPFHHGQNLRENPEVRLLCCMEGMLLEESDDLSQVRQLSNSQLPPCVVIDHDVSCSEESLQLFKGGLVAFVLDYPEFWQDLPAGRHPWLLVDGDTETAFAFRETNHPIRC